MCKYFSIFSYSVIRAANGKQVSQCGLRDLFCHVSQSALYLEMEELCPDDVVKLQESPLISTAMFQCPSPSAALERNFST
ncbi:hypothetical protein Fmac_031845 [Flemingia macrophylla]|uniref:Uncharacterized protein n=1 Tax=Flemingia macrophylla TaxID=520843 RepID=A0ABD1L380_9FABA